MTTKNRPNINPMYPQKKSARLTEKQAEYACKLGDGNLSKGLRKALMITFFHNNKYSNDSI